MTMFFSWRYLQTTTPLPVCGTDTPMGVCVPLQTTLGNPPVRLNWDTRLVLESDTSTWGRSRSSATDHGDCKNPTPAPCGPNPDRAVLPRKHDDLQARGRSGAYHQPKRSTSRWVCLLGNTTR